MFTGLSFGGASFFAFVSEVRTIRAMNIASLSDSSGQIKSVPFVGVLWIGCGNGSSLNSGRALRNSLTTPVVSVGVIVQTE